MAKKQFFIKDQIAHKMRQEGKHGEGKNWLDIEEAQKVRQDIMKEFPSANVEISQEHFVVHHHDGTADYIPRWAKIPTSDNGKSITGEQDITEVVRRAIEKDA